MFISNPIEQRRRNRRAALARRLGLKTHQPSLITVDAYLAKWTLWATIIPWILLTLVFLWLDSIAFSDFEKSPIYFFQRSGAVVVIVAAYFEVKNRSLARTKFESQLVSVLGSIRMNASRDSSLSTSSSAHKAGRAETDYNTASKKITSTALIAAAYGTLVWAYGDLPFRF